jgi:hypothetical protein
MLTIHWRTRADSFARFTVLVSAPFIMLALMLATAPSALAQSTDAAQACGATNVTNLAAVVPTETQGKLFLNLETGKAAFPILCGNGRTTGAVHIEVKHSVPDWADALSCMKKVISRASAEPGKSGKTNYALAIAPGNVVTVVRGTVGIIAAYPSGGDLENKWRQCSTS